MNNNSVTNIITADTKFVGSKEVISAEIGEEISLLNIKTGIYFTLDPLAARLWKQMNQPISVGELQKFVLANYRLSTEQCENDLRRLLERLVSEQLIEIDRS